MLRGPTARLATDLDRDAVEGAAGRVLHCGHGRRREERPQRLPVCERRAEGWREANLQHFDEGRRHVPQRRVWQRATNPKYKFLKGVFEKIKQGAPPRTHALTPCTCAELDSP